MADEVQREAIRRSARLLRGQEDSAGKADAAKVRLPTCFVAVAYFSPRPPLFFPFEINGMVTRSVWVAHGRAQNAVKLAFAEELFAENVLFCCMSGGLGKHASDWFLSRRSASQGRRLTSAPVRHVSCLHVSCVPRVCPARCPVATS